MKRIHTLAALIAALGLAAGAAAAADTPAPAALRPAKVDAALPPGVMLVPHVTDEKAREMAAAFFRRNGQRPGVTTLGSGVQYEVLAAGSGRRPGAGDQVRINYRGTLVNGTEFGSTQRDGKAAPAEYAMQKLVPGLQQALAGMQEGAKWRIYVPPSQGFGLHNPLFRKVTIFDVELIAVKAAPAAVAAADSGAQPLAHEHEFAGLR